MSYEDVFLACKKSIIVDNQLVTKSQGLVLVLKMGQNLPCNSQLFVPQ